MSAEFYATRLYWWHGAGIAKLHGVLVRLLLKPDLGWGEPFDGIDYTPEVGVRQWMPMFRPREDMPPALVRLCDEFLRRTVPRDGGTLRE